MFRCFQSKQLEQNIYVTIKIISMPHTGSGATRNLSWGCSTFWVKAHPSPRFLCLHSPSSSCIRCSPTVLDITYPLSIHLKAGSPGVLPEFFTFFKLKVGGPRSSPDFF